MTIETYQISRRLSAVLDQVCSDLRIMDSKTEKSGKNFKLIILRSIIYDKVN